MTNEKALKNIENQVAEYGFNGTLHISCEEYGAIRSALEYRTPKKPKVVSRIRGGFRNYTCSECGHTEQKDERYEIKEIYCSVCGKIVDGTFGNFCSNCGQAIGKT